MRLILEILWYSPLQGLSPELNCVNRPTRIPYAFVKEEVLSVDPKIMMLHDVISDKDIELLKNLAKDRVSEYSGA